MIRAGRKKKEKQKARKKTYNFTYEQLEAIAQEAVSKKMDEKFEEIDRMEQARIVKALIAIPVDALITHYGDFNRKVVNGQSRNERIARLVAQWYWCFAEKYVNLDEIENDLLEQGVDIEKIIAEEKKSGGKRNEN